MENEQTTAPSAEASAPQAMSMSAAADALLKMDEPAPAPEPEPQADAPTSDADVSADDTNAEGVEEAPEALPSEEGEPVDETDPEPDPVYELDKVHGNTKFRLRDGTTITKAQLVKEWAEAKEYGVHLPKLNEYREQLVQARTHLAQQHQYLAQVLPMAVQIVQQQAPQAPDPDLVNPQSDKYDPIAYVEQKARYEQEYVRFNQLRHAHHQQLQQTQQQAAAQQHAYLQQQVVEIVDHVPELQTPEGANKVRHSLSELLAPHGLTSADVGGIKEAKVLKALIGLEREIASLRPRASAYDKLKAQKPVAEKKAAAATPVAQPGRRVSSQEASAQQRQALIQRADRSGGSLKDIASIIATLD